MIEQKILEEIRQKIDIVEVVSSYINVEKKGRNYMAVCPFHDDHNPSMSISPDLQIFNCFRCKSGGNVFNFVSKYEHISFTEAVKKLASSVNYQLNISDNYKSPNNVINQDFYEVYDISNKFYINNLYTNSGKTALEYLKNRFLTKEAIKFFELGLSSNLHPLNTYLFSLGYTSNRLMEYGLSSEANNDIFVNRIMIPIHDSAGKIIGWSARLYDGNGSNKYINTKETAIFKKGSTLFNYHRAVSYVKDKKEIIVVEGNMDVIRLVNNHIYNVVALMGTSLTKEHINLLKRLTNNITLCLDGDNAGREATKHIVKMLSDYDFNIKVVLLKDNDDPDSYIVKNGVESFQNLLNNAINVLDYKLLSLKDNLNMSSLEGISTYVKLVIEELNTISNPLTRELILQKISNDYNLSYETLKGQLKNNIKEEYKKKEPDIIVKENKYIKAIKYLLSAIIFKNDYLFYVKDKLNTFPDKKYKYLFDEIVYYYKKYGIINIADFISYLDDKKQLQDLLINLTNEYQFDTINKEEIDDYIAVINKGVILEQQKALKEDLKNEIDPLKKATILKQIIKLEELL